MTICFADILADAPIAPDLAAASGEEAIRAVAALLRGHPAVDDVETLTRLVLEREKLSPTAMGHGIAFPHARTDGVREIVVAIGRSRAGVPFQGADGPVHFLFLIGTPPNKVPQYLALVGRLVRLLKTNGLRTKLLEAATADDLRAALGAG